MRLAENVAGTRKAATEILKLCFEAKDWKLLNEQILNLSKKRGQLKQVNYYFRSLFTDLARNSLLSIYFEHYF